VVTDYDVRNCGGCGKSCSEGQVCEKGTCQQACSDGANTLCSGGCVNVGSDPRNCGACGRECAQGQRCSLGSCAYEAVAACYWSGQIVGFSTETGTKGPLSDVGTNPFALAKFGAAVLVADGQDNRMYQAVLGADGAYRQSAYANRTGSVPNQIVVESPLAYVINASSGSLQILREGAQGVDALWLDGGQPSGVSMATIGELALGVNTFPQGMARLGDSLWVPLYGGIGATAASAGQAILELSIADPTRPIEVRRFDLKSIDKRAFDGGTPVARPWAITAHRGAIYAVLNNLNADTRLPEGPGLLARIEASSGALRVIDLGADVCLNPQWAASVGSKLAVSCGGRVDYASDNSIVGVEASGLVVLDETDSRIGSWASSCPTDAGVLADGGSTCRPMMPGRFAVVGHRVVLGDQSAGRVVVLEVSDSGVQEVRGLANPIQMCPLSPTSFSNVTDILAVP
jgi:hypothetical protein